MLSIRHCLLVVLVGIYTSGIRAQNDSSWTKNFSIQSIGGVKWFSAGMGIAKNIGGGMVDFRPSLGMNLNFGYAIHSECIFCYSSDLFVTDLGLVFQLHREVFWNDFAFNYHFLQRNDIFYSYPSMAIGGGFKPFGNRKIGFGLDGSMTLIKPKFSSVLVSRFDLNSVDFVHVRLNFRLLYFF
jgi:hypothetical protein